MGDPSRRGFISVLAVLLSTGWAANHFASLIPVLRVDEGLSHTVLDGVFGIYALGLLPGLLTGGAVSDRVGRAVVVLPGALIASLGTLILLLWHDAPGLMVGRLVVGIGAGLAIGAGTAWAADLRGKFGTVMAGVVLTSGFALGPLFSGLLAQFAAFPLATPFVVSAVLSVGSVAAAAVWSRTPAPTKAATFTQVPDRAERSGTNVKGALLWALPLAPWVFASATVSFVTMTARLGDRYSGPLLPGFAAALTLGAGILVQTAARHRNWGPQAGTVGAALAALGYLLVAVGGARPALGLFIVCALVLGTAYGLCLREGLLDLESLAPRPRGAP
ncbi:MFS transporter [Rhodococcus baikonurensis]